MFNLARVFITAALLAAVSGRDVLGGAPGIAVSTRIIPDEFLDPVPDPGCTRGIPAGMACCPSECEICGGTGCNLRPFGNACCQGAIFQTKRDCALVGPPCDIDGPGEMTMTPTPDPSKPTPTEDDPRWTNIDSDSTGKPIKRSAACFVMVKGKAYLLGGRGKPKKIEIFDPKTRTWTRGVKPPAEFHHAQCVVVKKKIFVVSSWFGNFPNEQNSEKIYIYDTKKGTWSTKDGLPEERRRGAAASVLLGQEIYVCGGNRGGHGTGSLALKWVDKYNTKTNTWMTNLRDMPVARDHVQGAVIGGKICLTGGRTGSQAVIGSTYCLDAKKDKWKNQKSDLPMPRAGAAVATTCDGKMMVAGGEGEMKNAFSRVDLWDGATWTQGPNLVEGRHGTGLAVARCKKCGQIFTTVGESKKGYGSLLGSTEVFLPDGVDKRCKKY